MRSAFTGGPLSLLKASDLSRSSSSYIESPASRSLLDRARSRTASKPARTNILHFPFILANTRSRESNVFAYAGVAATASTIVCAHIVRTLRTFRQVATDLRKRSKRTKRDRQQLAHTQARLPHGVPPVQTRARGESQQLTRLFDRNPLCMPMCIYLKYVIRSAWVFLSRPPND
ncbi:unnamed protein product [Trichogramma brassicae]|uniref:Uncharacterized protein n=1 Tax=Trichogramma brassicae TaxID=86971 RepID=A0A6H5I577_9HYME|nr:unnamed protein product [Trichogramma brassicae]